MTALIFAGKSIGVIECRRCEDHKGKCIAGVKVVGTGDKEQTVMIEWVSQLQQGR
jgi:hypothetical protein